jgi:hypothetical protein
VINNPPVIHSEPFDVAFVGMTYEYQVDATDEDEDVLNYLLPIRPTGMSINFTTGLILWKPTDNQVGTSNVSVVVTDNKDSVYQNFSVTVDEINLAPEVTSPPKTSAKVGLEYEYTVTATDPEGDNIKYRLIEKPEGMTIDPNTGIITWMPNTGSVGAVSVTVGVSDGKTETNQSFTILVSFVQPQVFISSPRNNTKVSGSISVKGTSKIDIGSIKRVQIKIDSKEWKDAKGKEDWSYDIDTTTLSNGKHTITVRAISNEDIESEMRTVTIKVNNEDMFGGQSFMMLALLLLVIIIVVAIVAAIAISRKRKKAKPKEEPVPTERPQPPPPAVEAPYTPPMTEEVGDVSDDEMEADLAMMEEEMHETEAEVEQVPQEVHEAEADTQEAYTEVSETDQQVDQAADDAWDEMEEDLKKMEEELSRKE